MEPKIIYIHSQFRVRCEISKEFCDQNPSPPKKLLQRAIRKLAFEMATGNIDSYDFYNERLHEVWDLYRNSSAPKTDVIAITLATGCPQLNGIIIRSQRNDSQIAANVTITAGTDEVISWRPELLKYYITTKIRAFAPDRLINTAELYGLWYLASQGEEIKDVPIHFLEPAHKPTTAATLKVLPSLGGIIALYCYKVTSLQDKLPQQKILQACAKLAKKEFGSKNFIILKNDIISKLQSAVRGVERFNLDLPIVMVAAIRQPKSKKITKILRQKAKEETISTYEAFKERFSNYLSINASFDLMTARLSLDRKAYLDFPEIESSWIKNIVEKLGYRTTSESFDKMESFLKNHIPLEDFEFAFGRNPQDADQPYIHPLYQDEELPGEHETVDFRKMSRHEIVKQREPIAEIRYMIQGQDGYNVKGETIPSKALSHLEYTYDEEGIRVNDKNQFIALFDGIPKIEKNHISLSKILIHKGNVNFTSGDIDFSGTVVVKGDIEQGATLRVKGDTHIHGSVYGGNLFIDGNVEINNGIRSGAPGSIKISGDMAVDFIENSHVEVRGTITTKKGIIGGLTLVGRDLEVISRVGKIYACRLYVSNEVRCQDLGKSSAKRTDVYLGVDFNLSQRATKTQRRLDFFEELLEETQLSFQNLQQKKILPGKQEKRRLELEAMTNRLNKLKRIAKHLKARFYFFTRGTDLNDHSRCMVNGILSTNCYFHFGKKVIKAPTEIASIMARHNTHGKSPKDYFFPIKNDDSSAS